MAVKLLAYRLQPWWSVLALGEQEQGLCPPAIPVRLEPGSFGFWGLTRLSRHPYRLSSPFLRPLETDTAAKTAQSLAYRVVRSEKSESYETSIPHTIRHRYPPGMQRSMGRDRPRKIQQVSVGRNKLGVNFERPRDEEPIC